MSDGAGGAAVAPPAGRRLGGLVFNVRVLRVVGQVAAIGLLVAFAVYLNDNYSANAARQRARSGWGFLDEPTGFNIAFADFRAGQPVRDALLVGVRNTAASAVVGILVATVIGVLVGVVRLSRSWVAAKAATIYVELIRNIPVLLIILFAGAGLSTLPRIENARDVVGSVAISNREIVVASPVTGESFVAWLTLLGVASAGALALAAWRSRRFDATGVPHHRVLWGGGLFLAVAVVSYLALDGPLTWSRPDLVERTIEGGASLNIAFTALTLALSLYHGSHIAEIVRGSILAVPHGQTEAATAIGLTDLQRLRFVVLPQAFRIAVPPTINQHLSLIKNTSLGIAVAYSDVSALTFRLIGSSRAPALQAITVAMAIYLAFSLVTSLLLNVVNRRLQLVER